MKIVVAGEWSFDIYEKAMASAFSQLGHEVLPFRISSFFGEVIGKEKPKKKINRIARTWFKLQYKYILGPSLLVLNKAFSKLITDKKPDLVFVYRGNYFFPATIRAIRKNTFSKIVVYNNDDPFGSTHPFYLWRYFRKGLTFYHHIFSYREKNIRDYGKMGIHETSLLRSYYRKEINYPIADIRDKRYINGICFIGHYEDDGRDEKLKYLIDNGIQLNIYGTHWERSEYYPIFYKKMNGPIRSLTEDYNLCINSNQICLVFLSQKNNDTYTRRCFEIPATGTFMLAQYTDDLNSLFTEGKEAEYFRSKEELLEKSKYFLEHTEERENIALAGYKRLLADRHEVLDRAKQVLEKYHQISN